MHGASNFVVSINRKSTACNESGPPIDGRDNGAAGRELGSPLS
jgi:hypothetical protein